MSFVPNRRQGAVDAKFFTQLFKRPRWILADQLIKLLALLLTERSFATTVMRLRLKRSQIPPLVLQLLDDLVTDREPLGDLRHAFLPVQNGTEDSFTQIHIQRVHRLNLLVGENVKLSDFQKRTYINF